MGALLRSARKARLGYIQRHTRRTSGWAARFRALVRPFSRSLVPHGGVRGRRVIRESPVARDHSFLTDLNSRLTSRPAYSFNLLDGRTKRCSPHRHHGFLLQWPPKNDNAFSL